MRGEFLVTNMLTGNFLLSHLSVWGRGGGVDNPEDELDEAEEGGDEPEDDEAEAEGACKLEYISEQDEEDKIMGEEEQAIVL